MFGKAGKNTEEEVREEERNEESVKEQEQEQTVSLGEKAKKYGKMLLCCIVLLAAAAIALFMIFREKKVPQAYFYVDEKEDLYTGEVKKPAKKYVFAKEYDAANFSVGNEPGSGFQFSADGAYLYYPYAVTADNCFELYVSPYQEGGEKKLLDKDVVRFEVVKDGKVVYIKNDGSLYVMNGEEVNRVSLSAVDFYVDEKGKNLLWVETEEDGSGLLQFFFEDLALKKERKKLQGGVTSLRYVSEDLNTVYFEKDGNLYRTRKQGEKEKIVSDVSDYFENSYDGEKDSFYYTVKQNGNFVLYYFNGEENTVIHENIFRVLYAGKGILMYTVADGGIKPYLARETTVSRVDLDGVSVGEENGFALADEKAEVIYFLNYDAGDEKTAVQSGTLYAVSYAEQSAGMVKKEASNAERLVAAADGKVYYIKDSHYKGSAYLGDLYCNQELIAEEAAVGKVYLVPESDMVLYYTDWDTKNQAGTLMRYQNGKEKKIAENVGGQWIVSEKQIFVFRDFDKNAFTLSYFNGRKVKDIAENVRAFVIE